MCEFCNHRNVVSIDKEEVPMTDAVNYILDPAPDKKEKEETKEEEKSM